MATRVYESTGEIIVDNPAQPPVLQIPVARAEYVFYWLRPDNDNPVTQYDRVSIGDIVTRELRLDNIADIQDSGGTPIGDYYAVKAYFESIMSRGSGKPLSAALSVSPTTSGRTWNVSGGLRTNGAADRDMRVADELTNNTPIPVPYNCVLQKITASTTVNETWEAHVYRNGVSVASLTITGASSGISTDLNILFSAGDEVRLRQQNGTGAINSPRIQAFFKEVT